MLKFPIVLIKHNTKINFLKQRYLAYTLSLILVFVILLSTIVKGLNLGIDFTGGVIIEINHNSEMNVDNVRTILKDLNYNVNSIQNDNNNNIIIRLKTKNETSYASAIDNLKKELSSEFSKIEFRKIDYVGPKVGDELVSKSIIAVLVALIAMMIYVAIRFNWMFGAGVVIALMHDIIATIGFYIFSGFEFDLTSIAAILTIVGYSVNDSVVIYDRIRENLKKHTKKNIVDLINLSINETLSRTIMTAATTLVVCAALFLFGGPDLEGFGAALFFGIAFGTYSSIYISAPVITLFQKAKEARA